MFRMKQNCDTRRDCTANYDVILEKDYTVSEFIETVLDEKKGEWGRIGIKDDSTFGSVFGNPKLEYKYGVLRTSAFTEDIMNKKIISVTGDGGWSLMNYLLEIEK